MLGGEWDAVIVWKGLEDDSPDDDDDDDFPDDDDDDDDDDIVGKPEAMRCV